MYSEYGQHAGAAQAGRRALKQQRVAEIAQEIAERGHGFRGEVVVQRQADAGVLLAYPTALVRAWGLVVRGLGA